MGSRLAGYETGLLYKHAYVPQVVSSVKAEYPPVGNYLFNAYLSLILKKKRDKNEKRKGRKMLFKATTRRVPSALAPHGQRASTLM